jgi:putative acetyltransferase
MGDITIRAERADDHGAIAAVVRAAFKADAEPDLVAAIRASEYFVPDWSLVADEGGAIVGHVMVSFATLVDGEQRRRVAMLSPLSVAPERQNGGIGGALVRAVTALADQAGEPLVVLEGSPVYYSRFGFEPSAPLGITLPIPDWAPPEAAQLIRLRAYDPALQGNVVYPPAFDCVT